MSLDLNDCKVYISNVDSQGSADRGIIVQVIGELSNNNGPWRKFAQTFFLAVQDNGYFVLNDICRYIKEEGDETDAAPHANPQPEIAPAVATTDAQPASVQSVLFDDASRQPQQAEQPQTASADSFTFHSDIQTNGVSHDEPAAPSESEPTPTEATPAAAEPAQEAAPAHAEEVTPISEVEEKSSAAEPAVSEVTATAEPTPAPAAAAPAAEESAQPAAPAQSAAPAAATPAPAPAAPAAPKSWATLAATNAKGWGQLGNASKGVSAAAPPVRSFPLSEASAGPDLLLRRSPLRPLPRPLLLRSRPRSLLRPHSSSRLRRPRRRNSSSRSWPSSSRRASSRASSKRSRTSSSARRSRLVSAR